MVLLCIMWCIWRERNYPNFDDHERKMVDLKVFSSILITTGRLSMITYIILAFMIFFLFSFSSYVFVLYTFRVFGLPLDFLMNLYYLLKKILKKKKKTKGKNKLYELHEINSLLRKKYI